MRVVNKGKILEGIDVAERYVGSTKSKQDTSHDNQIVNILKQWVTALENDKNIYSVTLTNLIPKLEDMKIHFGIKYSKKDTAKLPSWNELQFFKNIQGQIDTFDFHSNDLQRFIQFFDYYYKILKSKYPNSELVMKMNNSTKVRRAVKYLKEIQFMATLLHGIENDNSSWSYFRGKVYPNRDEFVKKFTKNFGDKKFAEYFKKFFDKNKEDREGTKALLKQTIVMMQKPSTMSEVEKEGIDELHRLFVEHIAHMRAHLEIFRIRVVEDCENVIKKLENKRNKESGKIYELIEQQKEDIFAAATLQLIIKNIDDEKKRLVLEIKQLQTENHSFRQSMIQLEFNQRTELRSKLKYNHRQIKARFAAIKILNKKMGNELIHYNRVLSRTTGISEKIIEEVDKTGESKQLLEQKSNVYDIQTKQKIKGVRTQTELSGEQRKVA